MSLNAQWSDEELPELIALLNRAMNCWDPKLVPKWAWQLEAAAVARMNDLKAAKPVDPMSDSHEALTFHPTGMVVEDGKVIDDPTARMHG